MEIAKNSKNKGYEKIKKRFLLPINEYFIFEA
jgi:hypothetical protein